MLRSAWLVLSNICVAISIAGCATPLPAPTSNSTSGPTPMQNSTPTATDTPTPSSETSPGVFPKTVLGMPVLTVSEAGALETSGKLNGRLVAVAGYWAMEFPPCPFVEHLAMLEGFCYAAGFADTPEAATSMTHGTVTSLAPIAGPEAGNGDLLWSAQDFPNPGLVVLVLHSYDSRAWQCAPDQLNRCQRRLVIDRVAWVNGSDTELGVPTDQIAPQLSPDEAAAIGVKPDEQLITVYPSDATALNGVDPRFSGATSGIVWFVRVAIGAADPDGVFDGVARIVSDGRSTIVGEQPLSASSDYRPGRVILDADDRIANGNDPAYPRFIVTNGSGSPMAEDSLSSSSAPIVLAAGNYTVHAFRVDQNGVVVDGPECDLPLVVGAESDLGYTASFNGTGCVWAPGIPEL